MESICYGVKASIILVVIAGSIPIARNFVFPRVTLSVGASWQKNEKSPGLKNHQFLLSSWN
jgi:hypothetical protein